AALHSSHVMVDARSRADHSILIYDTEDVLTDAVAQFLAAGFMQGDRMIAITTAEHGQAIREKLSALFDVETATRSGQLVLRDARELLASLMVDGMPCAERFEELVGSLVDQSMRGRTSLRAFGEMVDLLSREGRPEAAYRLEELWCGLVGRARFWVLCA